MSHLLGIQHLRDQTCTRPGCDGLVCKKGMYSDVVGSDGKPLNYPPTHKQRIFFNVECEKGHVNELTYPEDVELTPLSEPITSAQKPAMLIRQF